MSAQLSRASAASAAAPGGARRAARTGSTEDVAVLTLDEGGMILDCSRGAERQFGYRRSEMVWHDVSMLLPQLAHVRLMEGGQPNPDLRFRCRIGYLFRTLLHDGDTVSSELYLTALSSNGQCRLLLIVRPVADIDDDEEGPHAP